jgi:putative tricarboxylic transport membrane protein
MKHSSKSTRLQTWIGAGAVLIGAALAWGASDIRGGVGYSGVGPNMLPWVMAVLLLLCGLMLIKDARTGGWRDLEPGSGAPSGDWVAIAWVSAGVLANAALVTRLGFVLSCALCFTLAVRGLRRSEGRPAGDVRQTLSDALTGVAIAAPAFWTFTKVLAINLPGLTASGWI